MFYNRKKEILKNVIYITVILMIAVLSTYYIYDKFQVSRDIDFNSKSLDITYHDSTVNKLTLNKVTPVTDSVGLSSKSYNFSIKNNLTEKVKFKVKIVDDLEKIIEDNCGDNLIEESNIRISVKNGNKENEIYSLNELNDMILLDDDIEALESREIAIRIWIAHNSVLPIGSNMHYHGIIQVVEGNNELAINK